MATVAAPHCGKIVNGCDRGAYCDCSCSSCRDFRPDPRDAEIERLRAELCAKQVEYEAERDDHMAAEADAERLRGKLARIRTAMDCQTGHCGHHWRAVHKILDEKGSK